MEFLDKVVLLISTWAPIALAVVGSFALVASKTPNKSDDRIVQVILDVVNFLAANFGKAKNDPEKD